MSHAGKGFRERVVQAHAVSGFRGESGKDCQGCLEERAGLSMKVYYKGGEFPGWPTHQRLYYPTPPSAHNRGWEPESRSVHRPGAASVALI